MWNIDLLSYNKKIQKNQNIRLIFNKNDVKKDAINSFYREIVKNMENYGFSSLMDIIYYTNVNIYYNKQNNKIQLKKVI